jgi:hypothetical protein
MTVNVGRTLFSQVMDFVPWTSFDRIVARYALDGFCTRQEYPQHLRRVSFRRRPRPRRDRSLGFPAPLQSRRWWSAPTQDGVDGVPFGVVPLGLIPRAVGFVLLLVMGWPAMAVAMPLVWASVAEPSASRRAA